MVIVVVVIVIGVIIFCLDDACDEVQLFGARNWSSSSPPSPPYHKCAVPFCVGMLLY
jgi:hypothetical protein